jgi:hypothetical protein
VFCCLSRLTQLQQPLPHTPLSNNPPISNIHPSPTPTTTTSSSSLRSKVGKPLRRHNISDTQTSRIKRLLDTSSRVRILHLGAGNSGIDQRHDAPELGGGGQTGVAADGGDGLGGGVEVLLGRDELDRAGEDCGVVAQGGDDLVCELELRRVLDEFS